MLLFIELLSFNFIMIFLLYYFPLALLLFCIIIHHPSAHQFHSKQSSAEQSLLRPQFLFPQFAPVPLPL